MNPTDQARKYYHKLFCKVTSFFNCEKTFGFHLLKLESLDNQCYFASSF